MKRLILRIAALGIVVVLGLIAIAQAQRGHEDSTISNDPAAGTLDPDTGHIEATAGLGDRDNPVRKTIDTTPWGVNPLPGRNGQSLSIDEPSPTHIPRDDGTLLAAATDPRPSGQMMPRLLADPFARHIDFEQPASNATPEQGAGTNDEIPNRIPDAPTAQNRYGDPVLGDPAAQSRYGDVVLGDPTAQSRYGDPVLGDPAAQNPYVAPATISHFGDPTVLAQGSPSPLGTRTSNAMPLPTGEGTGQPGNKQLEGLQSPHLTIQKTAPKEIQVGRPATFKVTVGNIGTIVADNVEIHDLIPKGTQLIGTNPRASRGASGELVWELGSLQPGDESTVEIQLMPIAEGEIGSVATVQFSAAASARSIATKPELVVKTSAPTQVLVGETMTLTIEVSNPGSGTATGVVLAEHVPAGLQHEGGNALEYEIGELKPGESRKLELLLTAGRAGHVVNLLSVQGDFNLRADDRLDIEVIAPELAVAVVGPKRRYLEREAVYKLSVSNPGTAPAHQIELVAYLPSGLKFVSADNAGYYEEADQTVRWTLEQLPINKTGTVGLVTMPIEAGPQEIRLRGSTEKGLTAEQTQTVAVEGIAEVSFEVVDAADPIEVGGQITYEVRVVNKGSKVATNVQLLVTLPPQMQPLSAEGPVRYRIEGGNVRFEALPRLAAKADTTYLVRAQGLRAGDLRVRVQLQADGMDSPVTKEESTRVYADD